MRHRRGSTRNRSPAAPQPLALPPLFYRPLPSCGSPVRRRRGSTPKRRAAAAPLPQPQPPALPPLFYRPLPSCGSLGRHRRRSLVLLRKCGTRGPPIGTSAAVRTRRSHCFDLAARKTRRRRAIRGPADFCATSAGSWLCGRRRTLSGCRRRRTLLKRRTLPPAPRNRRDSKTRRTR